MVNYSKQFTKQIKLLFGVNSHAYNLCTSGDENLGVYITNEIGKKFSYQQIFSATSLEELQNLARLRIEVYEAWYKEMQRVYANDEEGLICFLKSHNMYVDTSKLYSMINGVKPD